jgi:hypothetical protein
MRIARTIPPSMTLKDGVLKIPNKLMRAMQGNKYPKIRTAQFFI